MSEYELLKKNLLFAESVCKSLDLPEDMKIEMYQHLARRFKILVLVPVVDATEGEKHKPKHLETLLAEHNKLLSVTHFYNRCHRALVIINNPQKLGNELVDQWELASGFSHTGRIDPVTGLVDWYEDTFQEVLDKLYE